jgi:Cys-rich repeat protein
MSQKVAWLAGVMVLGGCGATVAPVDHRSPPPGAVVEGSGPAPAGSISDSCNYDSDCLPGLACIYGSCDTPPTPDCQSDTDCRTGYFCDANGYCNPAGPPPGICSSDADCAPGTYCQAGACASIPTSGNPGDPCNYDSDCASGSCTAGTCD